VKTKNAFGAFDLATREFGAAIKLLPQVSESIEAASVFIRWLFPFLETYAFLVAQTAADEADRTNIVLTGAERAAITFVSEPTFANTAPPRRSQTNLRATFTASVNVYARARSVVSPLANGLPDDFIGGSRIYDRLLYPTDCDDLKLTREDLETTARLLLWLRDVVMWVNVQRLARIEEVKIETSRMFEEARQRIKAAGEQNE
jgi:hypothetical protein